MDKVLHIIGAGLAGAEAAWQAAKRGIKVKLFEMKPHKYSPAHKKIRSQNWFAPIHCARTIAGIMP